MACVIRYRKRILNGSQAARERRDDSKTELNRPDDGVGGLAIPDVKKALATARKHEAVFNATARTYGGPARK